MKHPTDQLRCLVNEIRWFHKIDLGHGIVTPGVDKTPAKPATLGIAQDLTGKSVLDIGALDGFFSFEAERRGARRVVSLDSFSWRSSAVWSKAGFNLARSALSSAVEGR